MTLIHPITNVMQNSQGKFLTYKTRWIILAVCFIVTLSNTMMWMALSTVTHDANMFYCKKDSCETPFVANQIFQLMAILTGIPGMYLTDQYGIKPALYGALLLNFIGSLIRTISSLPWVEDTILRKTIFYFGTTIVGTSQSFYLVLPTKIAEGWFNTKQRSIANVLLFIANPLGAAFSNLVPIFYIKVLSMESSASLSILGCQVSAFLSFDIFMNLLAGIGIFLMFFVQTSLPPTPPSAINACREKTIFHFTQNLKLCLKNPEFSKLMFSCGLGYALFWALIMLLPDMIQSGGVIPAGLASSMVLAISTISSLMFGEIIDKTKKFLEVVKVLVIVQTVLLIFLRFYMAMTDRSQISGEIIMIALFSACSSFGLPQIPLGSELVVEESFPVYEATSSGILVIASNIMLLFVYGVSELLKQLNISYISNNTANNWNLSFDFLIVLSALNAFIVFVYLKPQYKRMKAEEKGKYIFTIARQSITV